MGEANGNAVLEDRIRTYFSLCDETAERVTLKNGSVSCRQIPYTLAGLAEHLGIDTREIREKARDRKSRTGRAYAAAMRRIERFTVERALLGELQYSVAAMLLGELNGQGTARNAEKPDGGAENIVIVMDDPEGWGL